MDQDYYNGSLVAALSSPLPTTLSKAARALFMFVIIPSFKPPQWLWVSLRIKVLARPLSPHTINFTLSLQQPVPDLRCVACQSSVGVVAAPGTRRTSILGLWRCRVRPPQTSKREQTALKRFVAALHSHSSSPFKSVKHHLPRRAFPYPPLKSNIPFP